MSNNYSTTETAEHYIKNGRKFIEIIDLKKRLIRMDFKFSIDPGPAGFDQLEQVE